MLLYTRLAAPKQPKRRSRSGCTFCKEKKKKCDERRPKCSRCEEQGADCSYEIARPRQRKRRESTVPGSPCSSQQMIRLFSQVSHSSYESDFYGRDFAEDVLAYPFDYPITPSPVESVLGRFPPSSLPPTEILDQNADDEETNSQQPPTSVTIVPRRKSLYPDLAMIAPCPVASPTLEFRLPDFYEFSEKQNRRALVDHFCNVLSHLIVFREETGNPFQQLVLPLTRGDSPVTYAIFALASAHLEYRGVENPENSLYFHNMAIRGVAQLIQQSSGEVSRNEILAAIMLLVYYECLVQKGQSNIVSNHLKGALTVMGTASDPEDQTSTFLERAFRFYDVITALSNGTPPISPAPTPACLQPLAPLGATPFTSPMGNVDTLLGMATTLWPIIHRLAGLRALKTELANAVRTNQSPSKTAVLRTELESTAQAIETALIQWQPQLPSNFTPDELDPDDDDVSSDADSRASTGSPTGTVVTVYSSHRLLDDSEPITAPSPPTSAERPIPQKPRIESRQPSRQHQDHPRLSSIHHNAQAYRHAALVYLHRTILSRADLHPSTRIQTHARLALSHCAATVRHGGPVSALLWPLFMAACEAVTEEDRGLAGRVFREVDRRQGMRNIERAWVILGEVWRRADEKREVLKGNREGGDGGDYGVAEEELGLEMEDEDGEELWRRVCREMGVSIVFG
ncbi:fungal-specific transcription factor domain-containing protein [Chaetomium sp. MPI-SDFR-AT-0129]|nr:fungal-specific transcription factor domain-containing protein [Chaetomium sp. MPI-SDFR-AT-0129]